MKKCTKIFCSVLIFLFALGLVCSAEEKFSFSNEVGTTVMEIKVHLGAQTAPKNVTVTVKDPDGAVNFAYVLTAGLDGNAEISYVNNGQNGDYTCSFAIRGENPETLTLRDFKGNEFWRDFVAAANGYAKAKDGANLIKLITDNASVSNLDLSFYNSLGNKAEVEKIILADYKNFENAKDITKLFGSSVYVQMLGENKTADELEKIMADDEKTGYMGINANIPKGTASDVLSELSAETRKSVLAEIAAQSYAAPSALLGAFSEKTLLSGIKYAQNYNEVKMLLESYGKAGKISVSTGNNTECETVAFKAMQGMDYASLSAAESAYKNLLSQAISDAAKDNGKYPGGSGGGGGRGSGGGGGSYAVDKTKPDNAGSENGGGASDAEDGAQTGKMYFNDIEDSKWALAAINYLYEKNIINGNNEGGFEPTRNVFRQEFVKMLVGYRGIEISDGKTPFSDVSESEWYAPYVAAAYKNNLFSGYENGTFGVNSGITREEAAVAIYRMMMEGGSAPKADESFKFADDDKIGDWAKKAVYALYGEKIVSGRTKETFSPSEQLTRAEAAVLIYNTRKYFEQ